MKILWLDINSSYSHSSLAIPALDAQLDNWLRSRHTWNIVKGTLKSPISQYIEKINKHKPSVIFTTAWLFNHLLLKEILIKYKLINPSVRIYMGGPEFLGDNKDYMLQNRHINGVFRGEGEEIYPYIIDNIEHEQLLCDTPGICYLDNKDEYHDGGSATAEHFPELNPPESSEYFDWSKPFVQIETSRGCFNMCSFCVSGDKRAVQNIAMPEIQNRIKNIVSKGIREIRILDRTFNANSKRASALLKIFHSYEGKTEFHLEIHPSILSREVRKLIAEAPASSLHLEAGVQSLNDSSIKACNRKGGINATLEGINFLCNETPHIVHTDLISGLPFYTYNQLLNDVKTLLTLCPDEIQLETLKMLPGTKLKKDAKQHDIIFSPLPPYEVLTTKWITGNNLYKSQSLSVILDLFYNNSSWSHCFKTIALDITDFLEDFTNYFHESGYSKSISNEKRGMILWAFAKENYPEALEIIIVTWMSLGLSSHLGPGTISIQWKQSADVIYNPLYNPKESNNVYRYVKVKERTHWFVYNRKTNSSKSLINFIEIF